MPRSVSSQPIARDMTPRSIASASLYSWMTSRNALRSSPKPPGDAMNTFKHLRSVAMLHRDKGHGLGIHSHIHTVCVDDHTERTPKSPCSRPRREHGAQFRRPRRPESLLPQDPPFFARAGVPREQLPTRAPIPGGIERRGQPYPVFVAPVVQHGPLPWFPGDPSRE